MSNKFAIQGSNGADGKRTTTLTLKDIDDIRYAKPYTCEFEYSDTEKYVSEGIPVMVRGELNFFH